MYRKIGEGIYQFRGKLPGKTVTVIGGTHGDEPCGVDALKKLIPTLSIERGTLYCIYGNPRAIKKNVRHTGYDLNRAFRPADTFAAKEKKTYEYKRSRRLMPILRKTNVLLDLHSSGTRQSPAFIICEPKSFKFAAQLPCSIRSNGWDTIQKLGTDGFVNQCGGYGICIECGYSYNKNTTKKAIQSIKVLLGLFGMLKNLPRPVIKNQKTYAVTGFYRTKMNFRPVRLFKDFEPVKAGALIGFDGDTPVRVQRKCNILFCRARTKSNQSGFIVCRAKP